MNTKKPKNRLFWIFIVLIAFISLVIVIGFVMLKPQATVIQGQVEATEIRISGKVPGRILSYKYNEGEKVQKGDTLVWLDSPEVLAKLSQAEAAEAAANAQNLKAIKGARSEQITAAYEMWQKAVAGREIAKKSYDRMQELFSKGVVAEQKRDEAEANYKAMVATEKAAKSQYDMAKNGAEREDKMAAVALLDRAKGAVAEVESYSKETYLVSPIDGEISERYPKVGELVGSGAPIMNLVDLIDSWVTLNVREDLLVNFKMGAEFTAKVPALGNREVKLKVTFLKDMGSYAVWKSTKVTGQYDAKTFEVRARPVEKVSDLRPGMSVVVIE
ncbi:MAG: efflux RND transporter periplasmic adaptor subunit [Bacteroidales bacterium]